MQNKKYGEYGGQYVAESLMNVLAELETAYNEAINDPKFIEEYNYYLKEYVGRETPLYFAEKLSKKYGTDSFSKTNGQKESHRRNRSRPAWCGYCDRSSTV